MALVRIGSRITGRKPYQSMNAKFLRAVEEFDPDLVLVQKGEAVFPETIQRISQTSKARLVVWHGDSPFYALTSNANIIFSLQFYDLCLVFDPYYIPAVEKAGAKRVEYLPFGCEPTIHRSMDLRAQDREVYKSDVCFIGGYQGQYSKRTKLLSTLTDLDLRVWGMGWDRALEPALRKCATGRPVYGQELAKVYSASGIVVNIHHEQSVWGVNMRTFEATACGAFLLTDSLAELSKLYDVGGEVVCYENTLDLRNKIGYYLQNPQERREIARRGQRKACDAHTYRHRMEELLRIISAE